MALKYWFPMTDGTLHNQGASIEQFTSTSYSSSNEGKLGKCIKTNNNTIESGMTSTDWIGNDGATLCGWFKFPESEIQSYIDNYSTTYTTMYGTLMGFNSYNGLALSWTATKPYTNFIVHSPVRNGSSLYIASYSLKDHNLMNKWVHLACIMDLLNKQISLYINGELYKTTITTDITTIPKYPFKMNMKQVYGGNGQTLSIPYYCNDIRVYDEPISPSEIKRISQGLILHYSLSNRGFGNENLISTDKIANRGCTTFSNNGNTWNCVSPVSTSVWGTGFSVQDTSIEYNIGETLIISMEVKPDVDCSWNCDINNKPQSDSSITGNDHDDVTNRKVWTNGILGSKQLIANKWNAVAFSQTAKDYDLFNYGTNWGVLTSSLSDPVSYQIRNIKGEIGKKPSPFIPSSSDPLYSKLGLDNNIEYNLSGYQYNGTRSGVTPSSDTARNFGSYIFDENTDTVVIAPCFENGQKISEITASCWFKTDTLNSTAPNIFSLGMNSFMRSRIASATSIWSYYNVNGTRCSDTYSCKNLLDNKWHLLCFVFNNGIETVYIDGDSIGTNNRTSTGTTLLCDSQTWVLAGYNQNAENFVGNLSDFRLYSIALSAEDVSDLYGGGAV